MDLDPCFFVQVIPWLAVCPLQVSWWGVEDDPKLFHDPGEVVPNFPKFQISQTQLFPAWILSKCAEFLRESLINSNSKH